MDLVKCACISEPWLQILPGSRCYLGGQKVGFLIVRGVWRVQSSCQISSNTNLIDFVGGRLQRCLWGERGAGESKRGG